MALWNSFNNYHPHKTQEEIIAKIADPKRLEWKLDFEGVT